MFLFLRVQITWAVAVGVKSFIPFSVCNLLLGIDIECGYPLVTDFQSELSPIEQRIHGNYPTCAASSYYQNTPVQYGL